MTPLEVALAELTRGVAEVPGPANNPRIGEYLLLVGEAPDDATPWCSAFVNWCHRQAGLQGTGKANARSWLHWGTPTGAPTLGDVVVFWRGSRVSWEGHVAFYLGESGGTVIVVGGNQGNRVSVTAYSKEQVLGYRRAGPGA